ncbi:MAG: hypothetical protein U5J64_09155 [Halobacteriales archaeon]|nr:hypothetical protein [Halobacteriales archaeon]
MGGVTDALGGLISGIVAFIVMIILAIVSFFFTVFVVDYGASLAGYPNNDFTVLSAALLIAAALLSGGLSPINYLSQPLETDAQRAEREARMRGADGEE